MMQNQINHPETPLPGGLAAPAQRALASACIRNLEELALFREAEIRSLHGIGPNALEKLRRALAENGLAFVKDSE